jgi:hypothetical protein
MYSNLQSVGLPMDDDDDDWDDKMPLDLEQRLPIDPCGRPDTVPVINCHEPAHRLSALLALTTHKTLLGHVAT